MYWHSSNLERVTRLTLPGRRNAGTRRCVTGTAQGKPATRGLILAALLVVTPAICEQIVDHPGFKALPRAIRYATPLQPAGGPTAVIVYGKEAAWTKTAAESVQKAVEDWSGVKLAMVDDCTVTSDDTWLLTDDYRKTPLIVLGNAQDNRVMHALGTRYLLQSNRTWPGGDRYVLRTVLEPFVADVNWIVLEASTAAGLDAAAAKLAELLPTFPQDAASTIPPTRVVAGGKDPWIVQTCAWTPPAGYGTNFDRSVSDIALSLKGTPVPAGDSLMKAGIGWNALDHTLGGHAGGAGDPSTVTPNAGLSRAAAAMLMNGCRALGGRTHMPMDHYGAMGGSILPMRAFFQTGILTDEEFNEFENCLTLSGAYPNEYWYDNIGADSGYMDEIGGRHAAACVLLTVHTLDYVLNHCRLDDRTRQEIQRRLDGTRGTLSRYIRSFRDNDDTWELGESTMMIFYAMLHQGMLEVIRNGNLRRMADCYEMTTDNLAPPIPYRIFGCYAGLDSYIGATPGMLRAYWHGKGLLAAAAFYYDDPQYRWFMEQEGAYGGPWASVATGMLTMHWDRVGATQEPTMYNGVRSLPFDARLYGVLTNQVRNNRWNIRNPLRVPGPFDKLADRVAFRDGVDPSDAYLLLMTSQRICGTTHAMPLHNNSIPRYTDLDEVWLFHNSKQNTGWSRNVVSISAGKPCHPYAGCTLEAEANLGEFSAVTAKESDVAGTDWTRTVVHWRGHYFAVLDQITAVTNGEFNLICRWRTPQPAALQGNVWRADAPSGSSLSIENTEPVLQTAEHWECDGALRPWVLSQFKRAELKTGQSETFQNLMFVSGPNRPDAFQSRRVSATAVLVKGTTANGPHLALIGTGGNVPLQGCETDARVYVVAGNALHLAGVTTLKLDVDGTLQEVFHADQPANLILDCASGSGRIESPAGTEPGDLRLTVALPQLAGQMEALWNDPQAPATAVATGSGTSDTLFTVVAADKFVTVRPGRLTRVQTTSTPDAAQPISTLSDGQYSTSLAGNAPTWNGTEHLEIMLTFPEPTAVSDLRLVSITKMVPAYGFGSEGFGSQYNEVGDFVFTLVLSDDNFQDDIRRIENPAVAWEETPTYPAFHSAIGRLPTWRIAVNASARQIKLLPRATTTERPNLYLTELEVYGTAPTDDLRAQAFAADLDGDGANELLLGTSNKELAAYDADGRQRWSTNWPGGIFTMGADDLDDDGTTEALVYTATEKLHRVNGDGSERPVADVYKAMLAWGEGRDIIGGVLALAAWRPDPAKGKNVVLWSEGCFIADATGGVRNVKMGWGYCGATRVAGLYLDEPEVMATVGSAGLTLWSPRCDQNGDYITLASKPLAGIGAAAFSRGFAWLRPVDQPAIKGLLAANDNSVNWFPAATFPPNAPTNGIWGFDTGGVPVVGALAEDINGDGAPEVFLARQDGFVNVLNLADGSVLGLLNTGQPILGMAALKNREGKPFLAVGTRFGVHLFGGDLKRIGRQALPVVAFAGPGGKTQDRVYIVDASGKVSVLILK